MVLSKIYPIYDENIASVKNKNLDSLRKLK